jgi:hypothetical protein
MQQPMHVQLFPCTFSILCGNHATVQKLHEEVPAYLFCTKFSFCIVYEAEMTSLLHKQMGH